MANEKGNENYKLTLYTNRTLKSVVNQMLLNYYDVGAKDNKFSCKQACIEFLYFWHLYHLHVSHGINGIASGELVSFGKRYN